MEIRENNTLKILAPLMSNLDSKVWNRIEKEISLESRQIALDLSRVQDCTIDFIEELKQFCTEKNLGLFNIPSDIFVLLNIMQIDKCAKLYVSENDFIEDKHLLINRKFLLV